MGTIAEAAELITNFRETVALTGAGISQEAGIPTFRGDDGLWQDPELAKWGYRQTFDADPARWFEIFWTLYEKRQLLAPSVGHQALKRLVDESIVSNIVTQNVDGFDLEAGVPAERVHEVHGHIRHMTCIGCSESISTETWLSEHNPKTQVPTCSDGDVMKPDILLFGMDSIPNLEAIHERAFQALESADSILVVGASVEIPYLEEWLYDLADGSRNIIIVNPKPTLANPIATLWIPETAEVVLPELALNLKAN
ncbi:MAG: Sir2 family NAD-dependent protein deacetylase [Patescibacteria group bacterium]